jgi:hypothetical protein
MPETTAYKQYTMKKPPVYKLLVHPAAFSLKISHSPNKYVMPRKITKTTVSTIACSR